jgi:integral membrane protein (TIGR00529 family)
MSLSLVVSLILVLSHSLEQSGQMERLLNRFKGMIRRPRISLVIFPALIGLLPMPGGAIFSAPMVKNLGQRHRLSPSQLSYTNYWFRHIWEYWWPLYPGVLLASALADVNIWRLVLYTLPLTLVAVLIGYRPLFGAITAGESTTSANDKGAFFKELAPIAFVVVFGLACGQLFSMVLPRGLLTVAKELGLILALLIAIVWVWHGNTMGAPQCRAIVTQPEMLKMIYMVCAILIFKEILQDSGAVLKISQEMLRLRIPLLPIAMLLPFLVGGVAGITIAFVGTTFPILISLIQAFGQTQLVLPYLMLALASGFAGVLFSPLHLCLQLSNAYFETTLLPVYKHLTGPVILLVISALAYFSLLRYLLG